MVPMNAPKDPGSDSTASRGSSISGVDIRDAAAGCVRLQHVFDRKVLRYRGEDTKILTDSPFSRAEQPYDYPMIGLLGDNRLAAGHDLVMTLVSFCGPPNTHPDRRDTVRTFVSSPR